MAKAVKTTEKVEVKIVNDFSKITLELSLNEAIYLASIIGNIGGRTSTSGDCLVGKYNSNIYNALRNLVPRTAGSFIDAPGFYLTGQYHLNLDPNNDWKA